MEDAEKSSKPAEMVLNTGNGSNLGATLVGGLGVLGSIVQFFGGQPLASALFLIAAALAFGLRGQVGLSE